MLCGQFAARCSLPGRSAGCDACGRARGRRSTLRRRRGPACPGPRRDRAGRARRGLARAAAELANAVGEAGAELRRTIAKIAGVFAELITQAARLIAGTVTNAADGV